VSLNTGDAEPVFRAQYKVAHALWPVVDVKVQEWLKDGVPYPVGGVQNVLPDALSRTHDTIPWRNCVTSTHNDFKVRNVSAEEGTLQLETQEEKSPVLNLDYWVRELSGKRVVPEGERRQLLEAKHAEGHFHSLFLFKSLLSAGHFWPGMRKDCEQLVNACQQCAHFNVSRSGFRPLRFVNAKYPWEHLAIDLGTLNVTSPRGHNFILVVVDIFTRFVLLRPLRTKAASDVAEALWGIICDFGAPKIIQSDNGSEFVNQVVSSLLRLEGVNHRLIAAYNPRANGAAERHVGLVKSALLKMCGGNSADFDLYLPAVQRSLNLKIAAKTNTVPFSLMFARPPVELGDYKDVGSAPVWTPEALKERQTQVLKLIYPTVAATVDSKQQKTIQAHGKSIKDASRSLARQKIPVGATVMAKDPNRKNKVSPVYEGPYKVVEVTQNGLYRVTDDAGVLLGRKIPRDQLKMIAAAEGVGQGYLHAPAEEIYEVDEVLEHKGREGSYKFLIKWKGYAEKSWEPAENLKPSTLKDYWNSVAQEKAGDRAVVTKPAVRTSQRRRSQRRH
jgi:hypothetical protein